MDDTTRNMLLIMAIEENASLLLSPYTGKWYVSARIEISNGAFLTGVVDHRPTPAEAVDTFLQRLIAISPNEVVVTSAGTSQRRHWRWNGAAFAPVALPDRVAS